MSNFTLGAFAIILDQERRVLLCHRRDMDMWNLPGGGVEENEMPHEAVVRETMEETGLDVSIRRLVGVYGKSYSNNLVFAFECRVVSGQLQTTEESDACAYFALADLPSNTIPKHVDRIRDALDDHPQSIFRRQVGLSTRERMLSLGIDPE